MDKSRFIIISAIIVILASAGIVSYLVFQPEQIHYYTISVKSNINGIYGENYTIVDGSWEFDPLTMRTAYAFRQNINYTSQGTIITLVLHQGYCLLSSDFEFTVSSNMTISKIIATLYNSGDFEYSTSISYKNVLEFAYELFSFDLKITLEISLTY